MAGEWRTSSLGEVCDFRAGSVFKPALQGKASGEYPFVKVSDMNLSANAVCIQDANNWVSREDIAQLRVKPFPAGTVVFAKIGEALRQNRLRQLSRETLIDNNMMGAIPRVDRIDARYFYYALSRFDFAEIAQGTALPYLTVASLSALTLDVPPADEQRAIAHILGTLDDKIELNRRMSETLEAMARSLFKSWFVDFLPVRAKHRARTQTGDPVRAKAEGRNPLPPPQSEASWQAGGLPKPPCLPDRQVADLFPDSFEDSELGEIPKGWEVGTFGDAAKLLRDQVNPSDFPSTRFRHFSIPAFDEGQWPKQELGESIKSQKSRVLPGVVLLSKLNPEIERVWLVDVKHDDQAVCSTEFLVLRPAAPFGRAFTYCLARPPLFRQNIEGLVTGTSKSHQRAQAQSILALPAVRPPPLTAQAFERQAELLLAQSLRCRCESRTLAALRDALLPKLICGGIRVSDAGRLLQEAETA